MNRQTDKQTTLSINNSLMERWLPLVLLAGVLLFAAWLRSHLLDVPLERDEGEYAYGGQLLLQGIPPYQLLYNMKFPGIYAVYALVISLFGATHSGIHLGLLFANLAAGFFIFLLAKEIAGSVGGLTAALCFAVLSIGQPVQGVFANSEHFLIVPMLAGLFLVLRSRREEGGGQLFLAGVLLGLAFLVKQHGIFFLVGAGLFLIGEHFLKRPYGWGRFWKRFALFSLGAIGPYLLTCLFLAWAGVFGKFWFWTMEYARSYSNQVAWSGALDTLSQRAHELFSVAPFIWIMAGCGLLALFLHEKFRANILFVLVFVGGSLLAICPGFYFRPHYFVLLLPAVSLLAGLTAAFLSELSIWHVASVVKYYIVSLLVLLSVGGAIYSQRLYLFAMSPQEIVTSTYWPNPFNESLAIAKYIHDHTKPNETIAVIGSEPQIYFYSQRHSATGYIYMYPLMEKHSFALTMQKELIAEIEKSQPKFLVFVRINYSWLQRSDSPTLIYEWFQGYKEKYKQVGMVEIPRDFTQPSIYSWQPDVKWPPASPYWIAILERRKVKGER